MGTRMSGAPSVADKTGRLHAEVLSERGASGLLSEEPYMDMDMYCTDVCVELVCIVLDAGRRKRAPRPQKLSAPPHPQHQGGGGPGARPMML